MHEPMKGALTFLTGWTKDPKSYHYGEHWLNTHGCTIADNYDWIMEQRSEMLLNGGSWEEDYPDRSWEFYSVNFLHDRDTDMEEIDEFIGYNYCRPGYFNYANHAREDMQGLLEGALMFDGIEVDPAPMEIKPLALLIARYEVAPIHYPPMVSGQEWTPEYADEYGLRPA
jgi:hypothetical protein